MQYTVSDIEIFIITRNRPNLLKRAIESVLAQTVKYSPLSILDNSTNDDTEDMLREYYPGLKYYRTPQIPISNLKMLQSVAKETFFLLLHDDDLIHPQYVENLIKILNKEGNVDVIAPFQTHFRDISQINFNEKLAGKYILFANKYCFAANSHNFYASWSGSLTRTVNFKQINLEELNALYGKILDTPLLIKSIFSGKVITLLNHAGLYYYHHSGQDSGDDSSKITPKQFEDYLKFYKSCIKGKYSKDCYALYLLAFSRHKKHYEWFVKSDIPYVNFMKDMYRKGIIDRKILFYSRRYEGFIYKILTLPIKLWYWKSYKKITADVKRI